MSVQFDFKGKYIINMDLRCLTGLHIGGITEGIDIGGIDNPIIKDKITDLPYIPGSSLKGKLRSLAEWVVKYDGKTRVEYMLKEKDGKWQSEPCNCGKCDVCIIFGSSAEANNSGPTRLRVYDAFPSQRTIIEWENIMGKGIYTELKTENVINRITSEANPRTMERVPKDSIFEVEMIYDIYSDDDEKKFKILFMALHLLEDSTLGGSGNRGYGKVIFDSIQIKKRPIEYYTENKPEMVLKKICFDSTRPETPAKYIHKNFNEILKKD